MKLPQLVTVCGALLSSLLISRAENSPAPQSATARLGSAVYDWEKLVAESTPNGERRMVLDGSTATVDHLHCHITTLKVGESSGTPRKHLQEEIILVKAGTVEANFDGKVQRSGPGSVIFFAAGATTFLRNAGAEPATYVVVYYVTPLTPKS